MNPADSVIGARVCVIGAGVSGLTALAALKSEGHRAVVYERDGVIAGLWNNGYDSLHLFTSKTMASFPGYPMPDEYPLFPNGHQFLAYINAYARDRNLLDDVRLHTEVISIRPLHNGEWDVTLSTGETERFDAVVAANGHLYKPKPRPIYPGEFSGAQKHTGEYRRPDELVGSEILIVGAGPSATDIAADAVGVGKQVFLSVRSGRYIVPASIGSRSRMDVTLPRATPRWVANIVSDLHMRYSVGRPEELGIPRPTAKIAASKITMSTLVPYWIQRGRITVVPEIESFDSRSVTFVDGSSRDIDTIIWANGFDAELPFDNDSLISWIDGMPSRIVGGTLSPDVPNLYYNGWVSGVGSSSQLYSASAHLIAKMISAQLDSVAPLNGGIFADEEPSGRLKFDIFEWSRILTAAERRLASARGDRPPRRADLARRYSWAQVRLDQ